MLERKSHAAIGRWLGCSSRHEVIGRKMCGSIIALLFLTYIADWYGCFLDSVVVRAERIIGCILVCATQCPCSAVKECGLRASSFWNRERNLIASQRIDTKDVTFGPHSLIARNANISIRCSRRRTICIFFKITDQSLNLLHFVLWTKQLIVIRSTWWHGNACGKQGSKQNNLFHNIDVLFFNNSATAFNGSASTT